MFGFLFKRNKSLDKESNKTTGKQLTKKDGYDSIPSTPTNSHSKQIKNATSTDSCYPSTADSDKESESIDLSISRRNSFFFPSSNNFTHKKSNSVIPQTNDTTESQSTNAKKSALENDIEFIDETDCCDAKQENVISNDNSNQEERVLSEAERKAMVQLDEIRSRLISKETELSLLQADINMLAVDRDNKIVEMEGLTIQLKKLRDENELSLKRIKNFESELDDLREKNTQLSEELLKKAEQIKCWEGGSSKNEKTSADSQECVKELETKLKDLQAEIDKLTKEKDSIEHGRDEEIKGLQEALDDALQEKIKIKNKFDRDFAELQSANSGLMDDFEWKLRQIEAKCKKSLLEKDAQVDEKMKEAKLQTEKEFLAEKEKFCQEKETLDKQMTQINHLKSYEAEVTQLRGLTHEQQKALRAASRQLEQLKLNEKLMSDELHAVRALLDKEKAHLQVVQSSNQRRLDVQEEKMKSKLDKQRNELNSEWEDKMRAECARLKQDLCRLHAEEKHLAVESMKLQKDQDISSGRQMWESQKKDLLEEISRLKDIITEKESYCHRQIEKATTMADRESCELRRKLEKISNTNLEQLDEMKQSHSEEMDVLRRRYENTLAELRECEKRLSKFEQRENNDAEEDSLLNAASSSEFVSITCGNSNTENKYSDSDYEDEEDTDCDPSASESDATTDEEEHEELENCNGINDLREEVANLQGSIEKLTSSLSEEDTPELMLTNSHKIVSEDEEMPANDSVLTNCTLPPVSEQPSSSSTSESSESPKSSSPIPSDLSVPLFPPFMISVIPFMSYVLFQSTLVVLWTFLVIIAFRLCRIESTK